MVIRPGGVTPNARLQVGRANFEGTEFKVEPDGSIAGRQTIPHSLVIIPGNLIALKKWFQGDDSMTINEKLGENMLVRLPNTDNKMSWPEIHLKERPTVKGFGMAFANPDHPSEEFINHDAAINGKTLVDILQQEIPLCCRRPRPNPFEKSACYVFYAIVPLGKAFLEKYEEAWRRLNKDPLLTLNLWDDEQDEVPVPWTARIQEATRGIDALDCHPSDDNDLALYVRKPRDEDLERDPISAKNCVSLEFPNQVADYKLKVEATCAFLPNARPFNPIACGMPGQKDAGRQLVPIPEEVKFKMALHRALLRGNGFYDPIRADIGVTNKGELLLPKRPPVIDLIDLPEEHLNALIEEALPADRQRFVKYLSERPLGLGAITAVCHTSAVPLCPLFAGASFA
ncbi:hypothetical protein THAR02_05390 [Trichoderma harzianum]|uniref:Uncharacterized protein n=1 Tax=Trichoderma harzianum TaxID=5544 RepID=A0A0F9XQP6_TRIHA|nr:hypothetical protein THAR02_05390 [Trichoderma harzianum]